MISKNQQKLITGLKLKKNRIKYRLFIAEGEKVVNELLNSSFELDSVYHTSDFILQEKVDSAKSFVVTESDLKKISNLSTPNKVLALFKIPSASNKGDEKGLIIALDDIRDPGNLGTIIRMADWFGVKKILCSENTVDAFNPKVVMSTMGSISRVELEYCDLASRIKELDKTVYGTFLEGENIYESQLENDAILVIGNESNGVSSEIESLVDKKINIPQFGDKKEAESLNAAIATAICLSEFRSSSFS